MSTWFVHAPYQIIFPRVFLRNVVPELETITVIRPSKRKGRKPAARANENEPLLVAVLLRKYTFSGNILVCELSYVLTLYENLSVLQGLAVSIYQTLFSRKTSYNAPVRNKVVPQSKFVI